MVSILELLKGILAISGLDSTVGLLSVYFADAGMFLAICVFAVVLVTVGRGWQRKTLWPGKRIVSSAIIAIAIAALGVSTMTISKRQVELEAEAKKTNEASLADRRNSDPTAYLAQLKNSNDPRWEREFELLDKTGYEKFVTERRAKEEQSRKDEIAKLLEELKTDPGPIENQYRIYAKLVELVPADRNFVIKLDNVRKQFERQRDAQALLEAQRRDPTDYVTIENWSWAKGGFDNVMIANFTIKNSLPWAIKDINIQCTHSAPSGTVIDRNAKIIYDRIEGNKTKRFNAFSMGFIHNQVSSSFCKIVDIVSLR